MEVYEYPSTNWLWEEMEAEAEESGVQSPSSQQSHLFSNKLASTPLVVSQMLDGWSNATLYRL